MRRRLRRQRGTVSLALPALGVRVGLSGSEWRRATPRGHLYNSGQTEDYENVEELKQLCWRPSSLMGKDVWSSQLGFRNHRLLRTAVGIPPCSVPPQAPGCTQGSSSHYADLKPGCRANQNQWPAHEDAITTIRFKRYKAAVVLTIKPVSSDAAGALILSMRSDPGAALFVCSYVLLEV
ncbi:hypothetical protein FQN60_003761 [Etheostoma spectabile]|uniref:Uncharacterized protein n=1 Tax=Etheostoma spectabile TaxID=54343 RepID=A0A5J5CTI3_9PERO|nr:hypothetical protein FQN60_003761 [Etheostoma spectabile]